MGHTVLITGATGKSGRYAIERLAQRRDAWKDWDVRLLVRPTSDMTFLEQFGLPLTVIRGNLFDDDCLREALNGVDTLLHIVGICESPRVIRLAKAAGVHRAILVHTTGAYSKYKAASSEYIAIDRDVTAFCRENGIALTLLRPTMIYGGVDDQNVITFIKMMDKLPVMPVVGGARFLLQPVHRRDLGYGYADALLAGDITAGKNYDLSGKSPITLREMLTVIAGYLGKTPRFCSVPYWLAITGAWGLYLVSFTKLDLREKVQRLVEPRAYPHDAATRDFGYDPMSFADGVKGEVEAYLAQKGK